LKNSVKNIRLSTAASICLIVFSCLYLAQSLQYSYWYRYGPGAGFVPSWCSGLMLALSVVCLFESFKERGLRIGELFPNAAGRANIFATWLALTLFALLAEILGTLVSSTVMLTVLFGRSMRWKQALIYGTVVTVCCFVLFKIVLSVPVPVNGFGW
jgi:hypothetical protein